MTVMNKDIMEAWGSLVARLILVTDFLTFITSDKAWEVYKNLVARVYAK